MYKRQLLNTLLYPKAASIFGQKEAANSLRPFWVKSVLLFTAIIIPISIIAYICLPPLVYTFLPLYSDGISSAKINILTGITFISMGPSVIFGTLRKNILYLIFVCISLLLFWGVLFLFRDKFLTLESVAWLRFAVSLFLSVFVLVYTFILTK